MKTLFRFLKATLVGGLLLMVPLVLLLVVLRHAIDFAKKVVAPLVKHLPVHTIGGVTVATLAAAAVLLLLALVAGLFAQTPTGRRVREWLEDTIVGKIPGYSIFRGIVGGTGGLEEGASAPQPALAWVEECWVFAFVMEVHADGHRTVFVPGAPSPLSGAIYFLPEDRLRTLDVPLAAVMKTIHRLGLGSADLLKGRLGARP
jgi:uncharacterized membrane protein